MTDPDADLVRRLKARDPQALAELLRAYRSRIFGFAYGQLKDHRDAEEIAQDVVLVAWNRIHQFKGDAPLHAWLMTIARNRCFNRFHFKRRRGAQVTVSMQQEISENSPAQVGDRIPSPACSVQREAEIAEFQQETTALFARLPHKHRQILMLSMAGENYWALTRILGLGLGTVKSRLARARMQLRDLMDERDPHLRDLRRERPA